MKIFNTIFLLVLVATMPLISCSSEAKGPVKENNDAVSLNLQKAEKPKEESLQEPNQNIIENAKDTASANSAAEPGMLELYKLMGDVADWLKTDEAVDFFIAKHKEGLNDNDIMKLKIFEYGKNYNFKSITHIDEVSAIYENESEYKRIVSNIDKAHSDCMTRIANMPGFEDEHEMFNLTQQGAQSGGQDNATPPAIDEAELQQTINAIKKITEWIESPEFEKLFLANVKHKTDQASTEKLIREHIPVIIKEVGFNSNSEYEICIRKYNNNPRFKKESDRYETRSYKKLQDLYKKLK